MTHIPCNKVTADKTDGLNSEPSYSETTARVSLPKRLINAAKRFFEVDERTMQALSDYCG